MLASIGAAGDQTTLAGHLSAGDRATRIEDQASCKLELEIVPFPPYNITMEVSLAPEVEARLARIASEAGKAASQVVEELIASYVDHDEWFKREVQKGLDSLDSRKFVSHEEVGRQIERILKS